MELNGISSVYGKAAAAYTTAKKDIDADKQVAKKADDTAVIFEPSKEGIEKSKAMTDTDSVKAVDEKEARKASIREFLNAEAETRHQRMTDMVNELMGEQSSLIVKLSKLHNGTITQEEIEQAKKDTAEDGYWGAEKTSDRMIEFAIALAGNDPDKLSEMKDAFLKGYEKAEKTWGGELPELCQKTREMTIDKFDKLIKGEY